VIVVIFVTGTWLMISPFRAAPTLNGRPECGEGARIFHVNDDIDVFSGETASSVPSLIWSVWGVRNNRRRICR